MEYLGGVCVLLKCTWIDQYPQNLQHWDTIRIYMIDPSIHLPVTSIQNQDYKSRNRVLTQTRISQTCLVIHVGFDTMDLSKKMGGYPNLTGYQLMGRKMGETPKMEDTLKMGDTPANGKK